MKLLAEQDAMTTIDRGIRIISRLPFTRAIMLTGSFAEGRETKNSDIDFFVQVQPGHIWLSRAIMTVVLQLFGMRRTDHDVAGKICLNWFATFNAPVAQAGRAYRTLWTEGRRDPLKLFIELLLTLFSIIGLEKIAKIIQIKRIERDLRTHLPGSQVRYSDTELGFHPKKKTNVKDT